MVSSRNDVVDAFRGVAVVSVIAFHYLVRWTPRLHGRDLYGFDWVYPSWLVLGARGVEIFFVISGLVITMTVLRSDGAVDFAIRRFSRLWPPMVVAAALTFALSRAIGPGEFQRTIGDYFASLTFFPGKLGHRPIDGAYWSLSVEIVFYAIVAFAFVLLRSEFWRAVIPVALLCTLAGKLGYREPLLISEYWSYFLFGMGVWYGLFEQRRTPALWLAGVGLLLFAIENPGFASSIYICAAVAAMIALVRINARIPFLPWLGRRSYSLYLIHQLVGVMLIRLLNSMGTPDWLTFATTVLIVLTASVGLYELAEVRGQRIVRAILTGKAFARAQPATQGA
jgi:peptidoglycan/LPS O-acetylase OafA/YrhL